MTAAILCPGPSLARLKATPKADLVIGVNRAVLAFPCDVWAASDYPMIRDHYLKVMGKPSVLTKKQTWQDIGQRCRLPLAGIAEDITFDCPNWQNKTMTVAMVYAHSQGANAITLYGCDWAGVNDYDGKAAGENRSDSRWSQERSDASALVIALGKLNTLVIRA